MYNNLIQYHQVVRPKKKNASTQSSTTSFLIQKYIKCKIIFKHLRARKIKRDLVGWHELYQVPNIIIIILIIYFLICIRTYYILIQIKIIKSECILIISFYSRIGIPFWIISSIMRGSFAWIPREESSELGQAVRGHASELSRQATFGKAKCPKLIQSNNEECWRLWWKT